MTWPSFMAAPFIVPSAATICSAASSERARFAVFVPSCRAAWPAARRPTFADRRTREVGILSFGLMALRRLRPRLDLRPRHDVVAAVRPAHPGLLAAVVVGREQDERRLL